jgi:hypothetical protein
MDILLILEILKVVFGGIISLASIYIAILMYHVRKREPWGRAYFEIVKLMEKDVIRKVRKKVIYNYPSKYQEDWTAPRLTTEQTQEAIDKWGAQMDVLSLLYFSRQLNKILFFEMYGDVILRSAYKLACYANNQRIKRGQQFWLPFQLLTLDLVKVWKKRIKKGKYPVRIGFAKNKDGFTPDEFFGNVEIERFLLANKRKL